MDINYDAGALRIAEDNLEAIAQGRDLKKSLDNVLQAAKELSFEKRVLERALDLALSIQRGRSSYDIRAHRLGMTTRECILFESKLYVNKLDREEKIRRNEK